MELKRLNCFAVYCINVLLIVPYGIETKLCPCLSSLALVLLIVPYGIETSIT